MWSCAILWIGRNAVILSRVHIGDRAALGTEVAVTKNISHYALAVGNPARLVKLRFYTRVFASYRESVGGSGRMSALPMHCRYCLAIICWVF